MPSRTCLHCGTRNFTGSSKCSGCGSVFGATASAPIPAPAPVATAPAWGGAFGTVSPAPAYAPVGAAPAAPASPLAAKSMKRWGPTTLEGRVVDTSQIQISVKTRTGFFRGLLGILLFVFRPAMVLAAWVLRGRSPTENQPVFIIRIERDDGGLEQARIECDLVGATMDLGDHVSIWGARRGGVVVVKHAFNHTIGAEVRLKGRR